MTNIFSAAVEHILLPCVKDVERRWEGAAGSMRFTMIREKECDAEGARWSFVPDFAPLRVATSTMFGFGSDERRRNLDAFCASLTAFIREKNPHVIVFLPFYRLSNRDMRALSLHLKSDPDAVAGWTVRQHGDDALFWLDEPEREFGLEKDGGTDCEEATAPKP